MSKITAIHARKGLGKRVNIFLDGKLAFSIDAEAALRENLKPGLEITSCRIEMLSSSDRYYRCLNASTHLLSYRPRSEFELRERLYQRGFDNKCVDKVIDKLKKQGVMNDLEFAYFWKDNRERFSPRSQWLIKSELKKKGVAENIIKQATSDLDDNNSAYRLALKKASKISISDHHNFQRRLRNYLKRHGFKYDTINETIERLYQETRE